MLRLVFFGSMCAVSMAAAYGTREERGAVVYAARILAANWLLFASYWIYAPLSPAFIVYGAGEALGLDLPVKHEDMWALADLTAMMLVGLRCRDIWWGPVLWSVYMVSLSMHAVAWANGMLYLEYRPVLDACLILQAAIILMMGGGGCADYLSGLWVRIRRLGRSAVQCLGVVA